MVEYVIMQIRKDYLHTEALYHQEIYAAYR